MPTRQVTPRQTFFPQIDTTLRIVDEGEPSDTGTSLPLSRSYEEVVTISSAARQRNSQDIRATRSAIDASAAMSRAAKHAPAVALRPVTQPRAAMGQLRARRTSANRSRILIMGTVLAVAAFGSWQWFARLG
jgi:hypothetical protein